jgi:low temperature requirement protein LtrA
VIAVMQGMKGQEDWTLPAATAAFLGMSMAFAIWWWYFDGTSAVADRHIRSRRDAIRFHVWSYAHLPLYLGIAVVAAGVERIVHDGAAHELQSAEALILGAAIGAVMAALAVIGNAAPHEHRRRPVRPHLAVACAIPLLAVTAPHASAVWFVIALTILSVLQVGIARIHWSRAAVAGG